ATSTAPRRIQRGRAESCGCTSPIGQYPSSGPMDNDIQLISDGDGLAAIGEPSAVEKFLRSAGQWAVSKELDLDRLKPLLGLASDVVHAGSEIATNSGRWIKLTEESARLVNEHGLMETKTPGVSHLMVGIPGKVQNWLQSDQTLGSILTNPAAL